MESLIKDLKYGFRGLLKRKGFAAIAVLTLALGIGANTAIFTLVNAVMLKSLPVNHPEQLVLFSDTPGEGTSTHDTPMTGEWKRFSYPPYLYFRDHNQSFQDLAAFRSGESRLSVRRAAAQGAAATRASGHLVSGNYFSLLGVSPLRGRLLTPDDDKPNAAPATVLSYAYWEKELNRDPAIVGQTFVLNGTNFTVVGIAPQEFFGVRVRKPPDFWMPLAFHPQVELRKSFLDDNQVSFLMLVGRLKPGVSIDQAKTAVNLQL